MTDKVQIIHKAVEKLHGNPYYMMAIKDVLEILDMQEGPVSDDWKDAYRNWCLSHNDGETLYCINAWKAAMDWQKANLWKPADGDDLPEIDREVIALLDNGKVVYAHRPPEYWDGKSIATGKVTRYYPETYSKGGWNIPDVKFWLDVKLPKEIEEL